jgi:hypothetical protein
MPLHSPDRGNELEDPICKGQGGARREAAPACEGSDSVRREMALGRREKGEGVEEEDWWGPQG